MTLAKHFFSLGKQRLQQAMVILKNEGLATLYRRVCLRIKRATGQDYLGNFDAGYGQWRRAHTLIDRKEVDIIVEKMAKTPVFSIIVPVYNVEEKWLIKMIESVKAQLYPHWQLCLADDCSSNAALKPLLQRFADDDPRIRLTFNSQNSGIGATSNNALALATGDYIALLDHDDELSIDALLENAKVINAHPQTQLIYSDEDKLSLKGKHNTPFFKPDFSLDLLRSQNYIGHFVVASKALVDDIGGFGLGFDGAQDYDLLLRLVERTRHIVHIPKVLYHWREIPGSTATAFSAKSYASEAGRLALQQHCHRLGIAADAKNGQYAGTYRLQYHIIDKPRISIIIPFKDQPALLDACLNSIFAHSQWPNLQIIAVNNNSQRAETQEAIDRWKTGDHRVHFVDHPHPFNFSSVCNAGVKASSGEVIVLMNNDIEITAENWLEAMLEHAQRDDVGAVGAKLFYPNRTIQHVGIVMGIDQGAGHAFKHFPADHTGYFLRPHLVHNTSAVTAALLMVKRDRFIEAGGLDDAFGIAYNDVNLCLSLMKIGYRNVITPYCTAIHHESVSRGYDVDTLKQARHDQEKALLQHRWPEVFENGDPFYNPNLTLRREDYSLNTSKP